MYVDVVGYRELRMWILEGRGRPGRGGMTLAQPASQPASQQRPSELGVRMLSPDASRRALPGATVAPALPRPRPAAVRRSAALGASFAARGAVLRLPALLAALCLFAAVPAAAQTTSVWSSTLTVDRAGQFWGCDNAASNQDNCSSNLSDDDFTYGGQTYEVSKFFIGVSVGRATLQMTVSRAMSSDMRSELTLHVGSTQFALSTISSCPLPLGETDPCIRWRTSDYKSFEILRSGLSWTDGQTVSLSLTVPRKPAKPTGFSARAGDAQVTLSWTDPSDASISKYQVQRKAGSNAWGSWMDIPTSAPGGANATSYTVTSLSNGTAYRFKIRAVNAGGTGPESDVAGPATPIAKPAKPTGLTARAGNTQVMLSWTDPSDSSISKYQVQRKAGSNDWGSWMDIPTSAPGGTNATSYTVTSLSNGTAYRFKIRAVNAGGTGPESDVAGPATPAAKPAKPRVWARSGDTKVTLSWADPRDSSITKYQVQQKEGSNAWGSWTDIPNSAPGGANATSYTVTSLSNGTAYRFKIRAVNAVGNGAESDVAGPVTPSVIPAPSRPRRLRALEQTSGGVVTLGWNPPADGADTVLWYEVAYEKAGASAGAWNKIRGSSSFTGSHKVTGLDENVEYVFRVRAVNAGGPGPASDEVRGAPGAVGVHGYVLSRFRVEPGDDRLELQWQLLGKTTWCGYVVEWREAGSSGAWSRFEFSTLSSRPRQTIGGLKPGTEYVVRLYVKSGKTDTPPGLAFERKWSTTGTSMAPQAPPPALEWARVNGAALALRFDKDLDETSVPAASAFAVSVAGSARSVSLVGVSQDMVTLTLAEAVESGDSVTVGYTPPGSGKLRSTDGGEVAAFSGQAVTNDTPAGQRQAAAPLAPAGLTATADGRTAVSLSWIAPPSGGGRAEVTGYEVRHGVAGGAWGNWTATGSTSTSHAVGSLEAGTSYRFEVRATSTVGASPASNEATATTEADPVAPEAPTGLTATADGRTAVSLSWTAPASGAGRAEVTGYEVRHGVAGETWGGWTATGSTSTSHAVGSLEAGTSYRFEVRATSTAGASPASNEATATTEAPPLPLTGSVSEAPAEHDGGAFAVRIAFSEDVETKAKDARFRVRGGSVSKARRVNERRDLWRVEVQPDSAATVTLRLPAGAVSTADGRTLSERVTATVAGRPGVSVADARVKEAKGAKLAFEVTLSAATDKRVRVQYATSDGSAVAGEDYKAKSGRLTFAPGETAKTINVKVLDDAHDEGEETLTLTLSEPTRARLADGEATGTIENADLMPAALLARFGRATAEQVVEHIEERMAAPRGGASGRGSRGGSCSGAASGTSRSASCRRSRSRWA